MADFPTGIGVFQTYYESHQLSNLSTSTVTWITSLETFVMFFAVCIHLDTLSDGTLKF